MAGCLEPCSGHSSPGRSDHPAWRLFGERMNTPDREQCDSGGLLDRHLWSAGATRLFVACVPIAVLAFLLQNLLEMAVDAAASRLGVPSRLEDIKNFQSAASWLSPLVLAPILENTLCLLWLRVMPARFAGRPWLTPAIVAAIAALFHVVAYMEIRYATIFVNFFAICSVMSNARNRTAGFWASVWLHALMNLLVLAQFRLFPP